MKENAEVEERVRYYDSWKGEAGEERKAAYRREEVAAEFNGKRRN